MHTNLLSTERFSPLAARLWRGLAVVALLGSTSVAQAQAPTPFACTAGKSYLFQDGATNVYEVDLSTGNRIAKTTGGILTTGNTQLNAFGYNQKDGCIWGQRNATSQVVRIDGNYVATVYDVSGLASPQNAAVVGDVDANGIMYLTRGGSPGNNSPAIYKIDLTQTSLTATALPVTPSGTYINDWAISPVDGNLYAIYSTITQTGATSPSNAASLALYRYITTGASAGTRQDLGTVVAGDAAGGTAVPIYASNFGSAFMDAAGNFYVVNNEKGYIYKIATPHTGNLTAYYVATASGVASSGITNTDGARCPASAIAAPLPVQLTAFAATAAPNRSVQLTWTTASEQDSKYFEVQHSLDGQTFEAVGQVQGHGSTQVASSYAFTAASPGPAATHYYRLRQVDLDGASAFGPVQAVRLAAGSSAALLSVAPNPATSASLQVQVQYDGPAATSAVLTAQGLLGQTLLTQPITLQPGANTFTPSTPLAPGVYWLSLRGNEAVGTSGTKVLVTN